MVIQPAALPAADSAPPPGLPAQKVVEDEDAYDGNHFSSGSQPKTSLGSTLSYSRLRAV